MTPEELAIMTAEKMAAIRGELRRTNWLMASDSVYKTNTDIVDYRAALWDLPNQTGFPEVELPVSPSIVNDLLS